MINVAEILKQVPVGTKLWSNIFGDVEFNYIDGLTPHYPISVLDSYKCERKFSEHGYFYNMQKNGECTLWPSKDHRAWDDEALRILGIEKEKKTETPFNLQPFDKVLVRDSCDEKWRADFFLQIDGNMKYPYICFGCRWRYCIPYNDETKHLLGTNQEPPEKYKQ